jgi:hypothetical protein
METKAVIPIIQTPQNHQRAPARRESHAGTTGAILTAQGVLSRGWRVLQAGRESRIPMERKDLEKALVRGESLASATAKSAMEAGRESRVRMEKMTFIRITQTPQNL